MMTVPYAAQELRKALERTASAEAAAATAASGLFLICSRSLLSSNTLERTASAEEAAASAEAATGI